ELDPLDPPGALAPDLDAAQLAAAHERAHGRRRHLQDLGDVREGEESRLHVPHPPIDPDVRGFRSARSCGKRRGAETTLAGWPVTRHHGDARGSAMRSGRAPTLRIRRPHWRDPRLGIGVVLVALAVALGAWTFAQ